MKVRPSLDASTMTCPQLLLRSLLASQDVAWTAVPLGSEKNFQWTLMPALATQAGMTFFHHIITLSYSYIYDNILY